MIGNLRCMIEIVGSKIGHSRRLCVCVGGVVKCLSRGTTHRNKKKDNRGMKVFAMESLSDLRGTFDDPSFRRRRRP